MSFSIYLLGLAKRRAGDAAVGAAVLFSYYFPKRASRSRNKLFALESIVAAG